MTGCSLAVLLLIGMVQSFGYLVSSTDVTPRMQGDAQVRLKLHLDPSQAPLPVEESTVRVGSWLIDRSTYVGLPRSLADKATQYVSKVIEAVGLNDSPTRDVYELVRDDSRSSRGRTIYEAVSIQKVDVEPVPIVLLPSPDLVRAAQVWATDYKWGDVRDRADMEAIDWDDSIEGLIGRTYYFTPGLFSGNIYQRPPLPNGVILTGCQICRSDMSLKTGKFVVEPYLQKRCESDSSYDYLEPLALDSWFGAEMIGRVITRPVTPGNPRLLQARLEVPEGSMQAWFAYALYDGIGELRGKNLVQPDGSSSFERPVSSPAHDPMLSRHSLLRLPKPLPLWRKGDPEPYPHKGEDITLDEWFFGQGYPGVVLVSEAGSAPHREKLRLEPGPAVLSPGEDLLLVAAFPDAEPAALVDFLRGQATKASGQPPSPIVMAELQQLHDAVVPAKSD